MTFKHALKYMAMPNVLEVVSQPTRQRILQLIWDRERSAGEIAERVPVSFSGVSQHLA
ncbi:MAG: ArsR/SmtB family transcription factor, partial [Gemmatimonadota bacterium]